MWGDPFDGDDLGGKTRFVLGGGEAAECAITLVVPCQHLLSLRGPANQGGDVGYSTGATWGSVEKTCGEEEDTEAATAAEGATSFGWWFRMMGLLALPSVVTIASWLCRRGQQRTSPALATHRLTRRELTGA